MKKHLYKYIKVTSVVLLLFLLLDFAVMTLRIGLLRFYNPTTTAFIQQYLHECKTDRNSCLLQINWKPLSKISYSLQKAVLISEDDGFFEHEGIDPDAIEKSIKVNLKKKKIVRGGSTITQQLIKNLYLSSSKNPLRKGKEILLALLIEQLLSKQRILEIYLNIIEWGKGIYGAEAASQFYFKKSARDLSSEEAAYLAAIIPNPSLYSRSSYSGKISRRKLIILNRMNYRSFEELR